MGPSLLVAWLTALAFSAAWVLLYSLLWWRGGQVQRGHQLKVLKLEARLQEQTAINVAGGSRATVPSPRLDGVDDSAPL